MIMFISEFSGNDPSPVDKAAAQAQASNNAPTSGVTATRTLANEVLVAYVFGPEASITSVTAGSGYTIPTGTTCTGAGSKCWVLTGAAAAAGAVEYQIVSSAGTDAGIFALGASVATGTIIGTFKQSSGVVAGPNTGSLTSMGAGK
jgi:hypothetical protein